MIMDELERYHDISGSLPISTFSRAQDLHGTRYRIFPGHTNLTLFNTPELYNIFVYFSKIPAQ